ncbi:biotin-dependent carboxyltransferase family protein [Helicobacter sp. 11S02629-2]|uniref:5-oxoprolinase subunit C family protein n=1 Tax=Helicobacter sp. 11S02629-2 TaxID=1476195 RepID=UPI000BA7A8AE|nr:biotin-dependent carboxyltransferase family protein [Helicobacter sp. 11S02629-2]PAF44886.1 allophanate hydrolase [Helicobacter sp. 11S02629-2]
MIKILKAGIATSVQDYGRNGFYEAGIPPSGALDKLSYKVANLLVGNDEDAAVLECTFLGPTIEFMQDSIIALCGSNMTPVINGKEVASNTSLEVKKGDIFSTKFATIGARSYLAFSGGIDVPVILDSRSTYLLGQIGGYKGRKLIDGDKLKLFPPKPYKLRSIDLKLEPIKELKVTIGIYANLLEEDSIKSFLEDKWTVSQESDRVGYRFKGGRALKFKERTPPFGAGSDPSNIVDAPYPIGSIQVPGGNQPIALCNDAVSGGGYACLATIISSDLSKLGQLRPNEEIYFIDVSLEQALAERAKFKKHLADIKAKLS